jgi:hypothetical protein
LSVLTQDADNFSQTFINGSLPVWERKPLSWYPERNDDEQVQKIYNVWYSCYYVPPPGGREAANRLIDYSWQSNYIFNIHKDTDMYRYGVDSRYAKSTLVVWRDDTRPSFTDVKQAFMPKIHTTWHKFQNCLVQDTTSVLFSLDLINGILNSTTEGNTINPASPEKPTGGNGQDPTKESIKSMKQGGISFFNFRDRRGDLIVDPNKLVLYVDSKHLDKAERLLGIIVALYNQMMVALAQNDITEGATPKPRTNVVAVQAAIQASADGTWFIEKPVREFEIMYGERAVQYQLSILKEKVKYGYEKRWNEFKSVIGLANALMIEGIEDLQPEEIGITVSLEDVQAMQQYIFELANKMADDGEVGREVVSLVMNQAKVNWKYAYVLLMVAAKQRERENANKEELDHQRQMELMGQQLKVTQALQQAKDQGKMQQIDEQGKIDAMVEQILSQVKTASQKEIKDVMGQNKMAQDTHKADLENQKENQQPFSIPAAG